MCSLPVMCSLPIMCPVCLPVMCSPPVMCLLYLLRALLVLLHTPQKTHYCLLLLNDVIFIDFSL